MDSKMYPCLVLFCIKPQWIKQISHLGGFPFVRPPPLNLDVSDGLASTFQTSFNVGGHTHQRTFWCALMCTPTVSLSFSLLHTHTHARTLTISISFSFATAEPQKSINYYYSLPSYSSSSSFDVNLWLRSPKNSLHLLTPDNNNKERGRSHSTSFETSERAESDRTEFEKTEPEKGVECLWRA